MDIELIFTRSKVTTDRDPAKGGPRKVKAYSKNLYSATRFGSLYLSCFLSHYIYRMIMNVIWMLSMTGRKSVCVIYDRSLMVCEDIKEVEYRQKTTNNWKPLLPSYVPSQRCGIAGADSAFASPPYYLGRDTEPVGSSDNSHADPLAICS